MPRLEAPDHCQQPKHHVRSQPDPVVVRHTVRCRHPGHRFDLFRFGSHEAQRGNYAIHAPDCHYRVRSHRQRRVCASPVRHDVPHGHRHVQQRPMRPRLELKQLCRPLQESNDIGASAGDRQLWRICSQWVSHASGNKLPI